jgi:nanoRNase/pAp phosphatase (c-di-AMP/oligoRNAs hydrolase)
MSSMSVSLREIFSQELAQIQDKKTIRILLFTHRQADPDALCAASGLVSLIVDSFSGKLIESSIVVPQGASLLGQSVCTQLGIKYTNEMTDSNLQDCDLLIVVDTGDPHLLEPFMAKVMNCTARKILVDHHSSSVLPGTWSGFRLFVDRNATSTCEIITQSFSAKDLSTEVARKLLVGLMFDSQHLGIATESTLEAALILVRAGAEIDWARKVLRSRASRSELLARLKSAQRLQYEEVGKYLMVKTEVSSFQASVARMLLEIGADVGIAYGESDGEARVSVRSSQSFFRETNIDLAEQIKKVSESSGMSGGGHPTAASLSGKGIALELANSLVQSLKSVLPKT